jgi:DNA repair exonuclease SbcCD ATPase subunit
MNTGVSVDQSHLEHKLWMNELEFYREEITILEKYLSEIEQKNTKENVVQLVEFYHNQFERFKQRIDELEEAVNVAEKLLTVYMEAHETIDTSQVNVADQDLMRNKIDSFKDDYRELKNRFIRFEIDWM